MKKFRLMGILLISAILMLLTSCGAAEEEPQAEAPADVVYLPEHIAVPFGCDNVVDTCAIGSDLYLLGVAWTGSGNSGALTRVSGDGTAEEIFSTGDLPEGYDPGVTPLSLQPGEDGSLWMLLNCWTLANQRGPDGQIIPQEQKLLLCQLDGEGTLGTCLDLSEALEEYEIAFPFCVCLDSAGGIYFISGGMVHVFDSQLELQFSLDPGSGASVFDNVSPVRLSDGQVGVLVQTAGGPGEDPVGELRSIDREARDWGTACPLPSPDVSLQPGSGGYLFFCSDGSTVSGWDTSAGALVPLIDSNAAGIDLGPSSLVFFAAGEDGRLRAVSYNNQTRRLNTVTLTPADPSQIPEKITLTLACCSCPSLLRSYVDEFNRTSLEYRVEIKEYGDPEIPLSGLDEMAVDITAGNVPDLLLPDGLSLERLGSGGILEDLWPYIESDPELGRENVMAHVLDCASVDGRLYQVFSSFSIMTAAVPEEIAGRRTGWTLEDLQAAMAAMPEGCQAFSPADSKLEVLRRLIFCDLDRYLDWTAGTSAFDSEEFRSILSFVNSMDISPDKRDEDRMYCQESMVFSGRQLLYYSYTGGSALVGNFYDVQRCQAVCRGPVSFVGYPRQDGSCGSCFYLGDQYNTARLSMTTACKDKEGAWAFLRQLLLPQGLRFSIYDLPSWSTFPINRRDMDLLLRYSMEVAEWDIMGVGFRDHEDPQPGNSAVDVHYKPVTQAEYGQIMALYDAIETMYRTDEDLWEIVSAEAGAYFAGELPLEETVSRIQARVQLYINEQR